MKNSIHYYRKKQGLSQADLAKKLKIARCMVSFLETGKYIPDPKMLERICKILKTSPHQLYNNDILDYIAGADIEEVEK